MRLPRHISVFLRAAVTLGLLLWLASKLERGDIAAQFSRADPLWFSTALCLPGLALMLMAARLSMALGRGGVKLPWPAALRLTLTGQFFNAFLPGATGGDIYKVSVVCTENPGRRAVAASIVIIDRLFALLALLLLGSLSFLSLKKLWISLWPETELSSTAILLPALGLLLVGICVGLIVFVGPLSRRLPITRLRSLLTELAATGLHRPRTAAPLLALSLLVHLLNFTGTYLAARALNIPLDYLQVLALMPVLLLVILVPVSVNGHGIRELVLIGFFTAFSIGTAEGAGPRELAITLSLAYVAMDCFWCLPGALLFLLTRGARNSQQPRC